MATKDVDERCTKIEEIDCNVSYNTVRDYESRRYIRLPNLLELVQSGIFGDVVPSTFISLKDDTELSSGEFTGSLCIVTYRGEKRVVIKEVIRSRAGFEVKDETQDPFPTNPFTYSNFRCNQTFSLEPLEEMNALLQLSESEIIARINENTALPININIPIGLFKVTNNRLGTDCGKSHYFVVMNATKGHKLTDYLKAASASGSREVIVKFAKVLSELHTHGIVHNDLTPGNIFYDRETDVFTLIDISGIFLGMKIFERAKNEYVKKLAFAFDREYFIAMVRFFLNKWRIETIELRTEFKKAYIAALPSDLYVSAREMFPSDWLPPVDEIKIIDDLDPWVTIPPVEDDIAPDVDPVYVPSFKESFDVLDEARVILVPNESHDTPLEEACAIPLPDESHSLLEEACVIPLPDESHSPLEESPVFSESEVAMDINDDTELSRAQQYPPPLYVDLDSWYSLDESISDSFSDDEIGSPIELTIGNNYDDTATEVSANDISMSTITQLSDYDDNILDEMIIEAIANAIGT